MNIIIFGAGLNGKRCYAYLKGNVNNRILAFCDNYKTGEVKMDTVRIPILKPEELKNTNFDLIYIATGYAKSVEEQLNTMGVPKEKISTQYIDSINIARENFLKYFAAIVKEQSMEGQVAEAGVFQGEFAACINKYFPNKKCYLIDTFEGFAETDMKQEKDTGKIKEEGYYLKNTSVELVMSKMPYKENVIIKKGLVPNILETIDDKFVFVNLDMDLYYPTKEALYYFYPRMVCGGVILIHDYFNETFDHLKDAVNEFSKEQHISFMPIGDTYSVAIIK
jgi:hypothetical protein